MPEARATLVVRAHPRAQRDRVGPVVDGVLQVWVAKPPIDGAANDAIRRMVARALGTAPSRLALAAGDRGRTKRFVVDGMAPDQLAARLLHLGRAD